MTIHVQGKDPFYVKAQAEHRELCRQVSAIEREFNFALGGENSGQSPSVETPQLLAGLLVRLQEHFAEEEKGGLLDEAVCRLPRLGPQATALERQHEPLLRQLRQIVESARDCKHSDERWPSIAREFRSFAHALMTHESAENRIAAEAFDGEIMG